MKYQVFSDNEWIYPDSEISTQNKAELHSARGADVCFQILTDHVLKDGEKMTASFDLAGCTAMVYQLLPAHVGENSAADRLTTKNYDEVKHFVTRKAPFDVYELTVPIDSPETEGGRAAFFVRINVEENAPVGVFEADLSIVMGPHALLVPVRIKIYNVQVPKLEEAEFHMVNWLPYDSTARYYNEPKWSEKYLEYIAAYMDNQIDMRTDYLMIPSGEPVYDENGRVIDFDFSRAELMGNMALEKGYNCVMGGFSVHWHRWDRATTYVLWDKEVDALSIEGYRQLKLYFTRAWECVQKNGWTGHYMQCIMDEPQFAGSTNYRAITSICRQCMPGIMINDPVETPDLGGAIDIWGVKQAIYEKYINEFKALQEMGEQMWIYTCGFPAGYTMNRVIDIPLVASRLVMWMCYKYGCTGFLHWGYGSHNPEGREETVYRARDDRHFPPGNSFVVYNGKNGPFYAVRGHSQRTGAIDYELFNILGKRDKERALAIIEKVCRTFDDYEWDAASLDNARIELLEALG